MYNYPYGDNQQINLNWIISEIIALHQRLDPDYTAPTFTQIYPFSETQQLNLDWILTELKALKELAPTPPPTEEIDEIGQALIAGAYDADTQYQKNDYIVQDGKVYRANAATTGTFDSTKWNEVMLGNDLAIITRWADATNTYLNNLAASNVSNDSSVAGDTVKDALGNLNGAINNTNLQVTPYIETGTKATRGYSAGHFLIWNNLLYVVASQISLGDTFTAGTNILQTYIIGRFLLAQYYPGEYIMFNGAELGLSAANNLVNVNIRTERQIPSNITITPHLIAGWIRYNGTTDGNVEFVSASRSTANSFIITVRATNGISSGNVCGVFLQGDIALS